MHELHVVIEHAQYTVTKYPSCVHLLKFLISYIIMSCPMLPRINIHTPINKNPFSMNRLNSSHVEAGDEGCFWELHLEVEFSRGGCAVEDDAGDPGGGISGHNG